MCDDPATFNYPSDETIVDIVSDRSADVNGGPLRPKCHELAWMVS